METYFELPSHPNTVSDAARRAQAFAGGWFHTGDQGFLDGDGFLTLTGRIKELINRGGEKISPLEVQWAARLDTVDMRIYLYVSVWLADAGCKGTVPPQGAVTTVSRPWTERNTLFDSDQAQ